MKAFGRDTLVGVVATVLAAIVLALWPALRSWCLQSSTIPRWIMIVAVLAPAVTVYGVFRWRERRVGKLESPIPAPMSATSRPAFRPSDFQDQIIRVLRLADTEYLTSEAVAGAINSKPPVSDVEQSLLQLTEAGWSHQLLSAKGREFRLVGPGLDYAREKHYPALSHDKLRALRDRRNRSW